MPADREVTTMASPLATRTLQANSKGARPPWHAANQDLADEGHFEQPELSPDLTPALSTGCELFGATVQISPIELVKRHSREQYGIVTESIYAPARSRIEVRYDAPAQDRKSTRLNSSH